MPEATTPREHEVAHRPTSTARTGEVAPLPDMVDYAKRYAREKPEVAALWCFGLGFVLGWKLKPW